MKLFFFNSSVIDLKFQVKCEHVLCDQETLMLEFSGREYV